MLGIGSAFEKLSQNIPFSFVQGISETVRKKAIKFLLHRYVGQFLLESLSLDQLTIDLTNGTGIIKDLTLDIQSLNEAADHLNLPFTFVNGYIEDIFLNIPWRNLFSENCFVGVSGLKLTLHSKQRDAPVSVFDSMIDSMSTSFQIAQECLNQVEECSNYRKNDNVRSSLSENKNVRESESVNIDAIEHFAKAIETILNKFKIRFTNSIIRFEYHPKSSYSGMAIEVKLDNIDYFDEAGFEKEHINIDSDKNPIDLSPLTSKKFLIEGVSIFIDEFPLKTHNDTYVNDEEDFDFKRSQELDVSEKYDDPIGNSTTDINDSFSSVYDTTTYLDINEEIYKTTPVLVAKLLNRLEIKVQLRKSDNVSGPKVKFELNCGCLVTFLSPRQVHLLLELFEGLTSPVNGYQKAIDNKPLERAQPSSVGSKDEVKVTFNELQKIVTPFNRVANEALNNKVGWSSPPDFLSEDDFYYPTNGMPIENSFKLSHPMANSTLTDISDMDSSFTSNAASHVNSNNTKKDNTLTNFKIRVNSMCVVILHDEVIIPSGDKAEVVTRSSINEMHQKAESFFSGISGSFNPDSCYEEFVDLKNKVSGACSDSHLRFIGAAIVVEGNEKLFTNKWELKTNITAGLCELKECLNESDTDTPKIIYNKLLEFKYNDFSSTSHQFQFIMKPKVQININQSQNIKSVSRPMRRSIPKLEIVVTLDDCITEIDISLIDRINLLLTRQDVIIRKKESISIDKLPPSHLDKASSFKNVMNEAPSKEETITNLIIKSSHISMKIFFPIPDLRPLSDMNRIPWWKRNVRKEVIWLEAEHFHLNSNLSAFYTNNFEILSNYIHLLFQETEDITPISILKATGTSGVEEGFDPVRIYIQSFPSKFESYLDDEPMPERDDMGKSMMGFLTGVDDKAADLFSKRKVAGNNKPDFNDLTIPSDTEEVNKFINETLKNVQFDIDITLIDVQFILPSKHVYEVIYNRLVSDLLLWTPSAPKKSNKSMSSLTTMIDDLSIGTTLIPDSYYTSSQLKPNSLNFDDNNKDYNSYSSVYERCSTFSHKNVFKSSCGQTFIGLQVKIGNAAGSIHTPYRDNDKIIPGKYGDVSFTFENGFMFIASGYKGDMNALQGCIGLKSITAYHKPDNITPFSSVQLNSEFSSLIKKMDPVLHPCDAMYRIGGGNAPFNKSRDCVGISFKADFDILKNEKVFELAGDMYGLTLRYSMKNSSESWLSQIKDMFSVEDYPVAGYTLPDVVTELNFQFKYCGIDYRPLYLPLKSYIAIDSLAVTSNLTIKGNSSVMLFIAEDVGLFLSNNLAAKKVDLKRNYVCVVDVGIFEICMKLQDVSSSGPTTELLFSNNIIHIRTCSDSCKAFMELLIYFSGGGDLIQDTSTSKYETHCETVIIEPSLAEETICSGYNQNILNQDNDIANKMTEAMFESSLLDKSVVGSVVVDTHENVAEFFFPGEASKNRLQKGAKKFQQVTECEDSVAALLGEAAIDINFDHFDTERKHSTDDEFCLLDDGLGTGIKSPTGKPKAKHIKYERISIKDDYFDPATNDFESRRDTPKPCYKCNLQEMSIVWHMYGGQDFQAVDDKYESDKNGNNCRNNKKLSKSPCDSPEIINKSNRGLNVIFKNGDTTIVSGRETPLSLHASPTTLLKPNANVKWYSLGGPNRCHDILMEIHLSKIKLQYDLYPDGSIISQHVFSVNDIEIQDHLLTSDFNMFLYQFSSETFPKRASADMIRVKALSRKGDPSYMYETNLNISCRPIQVNIDQDALIFLYEFMETIASVDIESDYGEEEKPQAVLQQTPVMSMGCSNGSYSNSKIKYENENNIENQEEAANSPIYFRTVVFSPDVPISIDYKGKHVDINCQYGPIAGLIMGLGQLNKSKVTLKSLEFKTGMLGVNKLCSSLLYEWLYDIMNNQLPSIIQGVGPLHSVVNLFNGIKDLFWLPIEQYNKDGRVIRGLQRGTAAFTSSSAYAVLDLAGRFVGTIQCTAETMYDMVSSGPSVRKKAYKTRKGQPKDIREGVTTAFGLVRNGFGDTASTIIKVAAEEHSHKGVAGAVGGVLRQIPPTIVQPIIIASEATCTVIGGLTNQLVPDAGKEAAKKWKA